MPTARTASPVTLTAFGALMDPDYVRQVTSDPCAAKAAAQQSERGAPAASSAWTRWWSSCAVELQRTREKTIRSMRF